MLATLPSSRASMASSVLVFLVGILRPSTMPFTPTRVTTLKLAEPSLKTSSLLTLPRAVSSPSIWDAKTTPVISKASTSASANTLRSGLRSRRHPPSISTTMLLLANGRLSLTVLPFPPFLSLSNRRAQTCRLAVPSPSSPLLNLIRIFLKPSSTKFTVASRVPQASLRLMAKSAGSSHASLRTSWPSRSSRCLISKPCSPLSHASLVNVLSPFTLST
jgi:hypothetical protein